MSYKHHADSTSRHHFHFAVCASCKRKIHLDSYVCPFCGTRASNKKIYTSTNTDDEILCQSLNLPDQCIVCPHTVQKGKDPCFSIRCFATEKGRANLEGDCDTCFGIRASCCAYTFSRHQNTYGSQPVSKDIDTLKSTITNLATSKKIRQEVTI